MPTSTASQPPASKTTATQAASKAVAPQTLDVDPQAKPIVAAEPASSTDDPFSDPFGDNQQAIKKQAKVSDKSQDPARQSSGAAQDKSETKPAGAADKDLPWRDPGVIQVSATIPVQSTPEKKSVLKSTALSWIRPKSPAGGAATSGGDKSKSDEDGPKLLDVDESNLEELRSKILPVLNQEPARSDRRPEKIEDKIAEGPKDEINPCPPDSERPARIGEIKADIRFYVMHEKTFRRTDVLDTNPTIPQECPLGNEIFQPRNWSCTNYTWKASGLCHKPLYFEQVKVERYGHTFGGPWLSPIIQPALSTAHFFGSALILPYKAGMDLPWECQYPLGYYRPGNCAPYSIGPFPLSARGAALEAGVVVGLVFLIP